MIIFNVQYHQACSLFLVCQVLCVERSRRHICVFSHVFTQVCSYLSVIIHICLVEIIPQRLLHHSVIIRVYLYLPFSGSASTATLPISSTSGHISFRIGKTYSIEGGSYLRMTSLCICFFYVFNFVAVIRNKDL